MEWEDYYEDYLLFKKMSTYKEIAYQAAAIIGQDGKVWVQTSNFPQVKAEERNAIMRELDDPGTLTTMGLYLGGTKYVVIGVEPGDVIRARKVINLSTPIFLSYVTFSFGRYFSWTHIKQLSTVARSIQ
ncbi:uncharacterized protein J3R85_004640 [Psidium guajava]|nr:uncharacterized protein J3R85_004640 [Psidium guajava]